MRSVASNTATPSNLCWPQNQCGKKRRATDATHRSSLVTACTDLVHGDASLEFAINETTSSDKECLPDVHVLCRSATDSCTMYNVVSCSGQSCSRTRRSTIANCKSSLLRFFRKEQRQIRKSAKSPTTNDKREQPFESTVSMRSMLTHDITRDDTELPSLQHLSPSKQETSTSLHVGMTEKAMYNLHLQAYLRDTIEEYLGDLLDCNDLEFLYEESDESDEDDDCPENSGGVQSKEYASEDRVPMFEFYFPLSRENSPLQFDEVSEITSNDSYND